MPGQTLPAQPARDRNAQGRPENARPRDRFGAPLPRGAPDEMPARVDPADVVTTVDEALLWAARLFDSERFFEAHEFLEFVWKSPDVAPADRDFWKGVTQVAVGCCHTQRGNTTGAITLLERATRYMAPYPGVYHGVDAGRLAAEAAKLVARVRERGASPDIGFFGFPVA